MTRILSIAQHARLDKLPPEVKVIGWEHDGPVLRVPDGGERRLTPLGRLNVRRIAGTERAA